MRADWRTGVPQKTIEKHGKPVTLLLKILRHRFNSKLS